MPVRLVSALGFAMLILFSVVPIAHAAAPLKVPPSVELVVILAMQNDAGPDDKEVANWPAAGTAPLSLYKTRKVLQHVQKQPLTKDNAYVVQVANGPTLTLTFKDVVPADEKHGARYSIGALLQAAGSSTPVGILAKPDQRVFIAGPNYQKGDQKGTLFFGVHILKD
jgi:hypothetical protein